MRYASLPGPIQDSNAFPSILDRYEEIDFWVLCPSHPEATRGMEPRRTLRDGGLRPPPRLPRPRHGQSLKRRAFMLVVGMPMALMPMTLKRQVKNPPAPRPIRPTTTGAAIGRATTSWSRSPVEKSPMVNVSEYVPLNEVCATMRSG